jgi:hypothetical protein
MKKIFLLTSTIFLMSMMSFAQKPEGRGGERMKRLESYKIAFISDKLALTPEESEKFWPIYRQFQDQRKTVVKNSKPAKLLVDMTDAEADSFIATQLDKEEKIFQLKKEYVKKLKGVIPSKKIAKLQKLEAEFKKEVMKRMKERKKEGKDFNLKD